MKHVLLTVWLAFGATCLLAQKPRFTVEGDAHKVASWSGQNPRSAHGYFDDWGYAYNQPVEIAATENGAVVRAGRYGTDSEVLRIQTADRRNLEVAVYRYDFNLDGGYEGFVLYSPKPGEVHMNVYGYINDSPRLIGTFHGLDKVILHKNIVSIPYEYIYEDFANANHYVYFDRDFFELKRHIPDEEPEK